MKNTLFAIGEALIDFIPSETGCDFGNVKSFSPKVGGAPANVLGAFAKLGGKTQLITQLGNDPFGDKIVNELAGFNIGLDNVLLTDRANTALAFVSLANDGNRTFSFYRNPSADMLYNAENIRGEMFEDCYALHFCSVSLGNFPMKEAHEKAIELAKKQGAIISFDPNIRFPLWNDKRKLKEAIDEFLSSADIIKISDEEIEFITGTNDIEKGSKMLLENAKIVLCTCGAEGAYAFTKNAGVYVPSKKVKAVDTTGAGDAFNGSFLYNLYRNGYERYMLDKISKDELNQFVKASNDYCGKSVQRQGAIESYPDAL
ncbi:MAG: carbohydrate kinase [Clostridiales bacterium]|nr:carbohydrate kinase [Clostridiales bacterium]